jgi:hypothetical protein
VDIHHLLQQSLHRLSRRSGTPRAGLLHQLFGQRLGPPGASSGGSRRTHSPGSLPIVGWATEMGCSLVQPQETLGLTDHPGIPTATGQVLQFLSLAVGQTYASHPIPPQPAKVRIAQIHLFVNQCMGIYLKSACNSSSGGVNCTAYNNTLYSVRGPLPNTPLSAFNVDYRMSRLLEPALAS